MDDLVALFWDNYSHNTKTYVNHLNVVQWHVKHVKHYIKSHPDLRLRDHSCL